MKRLAMGIGALLLVFMPLSLTACGSLAAGAGDIAVSASSTSNTQQHALAAAQAAYTVVAEAATVYVRTANPPPEVRAEIRRYNDGIYSVLVQAREANARGNSPAVAAALVTLRTQSGAFRSFLAGRGVPVPALPAF